MKLVIWPMRWTAICDKLRTQVRGQTPATRTGLDLRVASKQEVHNKMKEESQLSPTLIYEMVAKAGFRKHFHLGGFEATKELLELCNIDRTKQVLEVGCASGRTACYLARTKDCRVTGVDLLPGMVDRAKERAIREGVEDRVDFRVGDALALPFEEERFDIVIGEFITGLVGDKRGAACEYIRVARPGGTIGLNEATWLKPPPKELAEQLSQIFGVRGDLLPAEGWLELLASVGLNDIQARSYKAASLSNRRDDMADLLRTLPRVLSMYATNSAFRHFIRVSVSLPKDFLDYFGYGLYVGSKR
jgi:arsenite methyltransferase